MKSKYTLYIFEKQLCHKQNFARRISDNIKKYIKKILHNGLQKQKHVI